MLASPERGLHIPHGTPLEIPIVGSSVLYGDSWTGYDFFIVLSVTLCGDEQLQKWTTGTAGSTGKQTEKGRVCFIC